MKFPVKIVKDGDEFTVNNQDQLDFHRNQGWELADGQVEDMDEIESDDPMEALQEAMRMTDKRFTALEESLQSLRLLVEAQGEVIDKLTAQVEGDPTAPPAPEAPPIVPPVPPVPSK